MEYTFPKTVNLAPSGPQRDVPGMGFPESLMNSKLPIYVVRMG